MLRPLTAGESENQFNLDENLEIKMKILKNVKLFLEICPEDITGNRRKVVY